jgi:Tol biopolymer transport system component
MHGITVGGGMAQVAETREETRRFRHLQVACFVLNRGRMLTELRAGLCLISAAIALLLPGPVAAIQRATPQSIRVTSGADHVHSTGRSWGRYFAFSSPVDLTGEGSIASQAYVFSVVDYACQFGRPDLQLPWEDPVTCPNPPHPYLVKATSAGPADGVSNPSVNSTGTIVAFEAYGSFEGKCTGGAVNRKQVFVRDIVAGKTTAVTCNPDGDSYGPSLNDAGGALVFTSTSSFLGSPVGIPQVYVYQYSSPDPRRGVGEITPISYGPSALGRAASGAPMLNKLGTHVIFESRANLLGDGSDTGRWNIFWFDRQLERLSQITNGNGDSRNPYVEEKRPGSIFFDSTATDLQGTDGLPGGRQIYRAEIKESSDFPPIEQWTFGPGNSWMPAVEPNGGKVAFLSDGDHLLNGTSGPRLFAIDFRDATRVLYQITGRGNIGGRIGANLGAWFLTFDSDDDVGGYGICGRQIWIVVYDPDHYTEGGHVRLAATQLGQKPGEPFPGNPSNSCGDGDGCTADSCISNACFHTPRPEGFVCFGGDQCTQGVGTCQSGECTITPALVCDDSNKCTDDICDPNTGCGHTDVDCDDQNPCTMDTCDAAQGCMHTELTSMEGVSCQNAQVKASTPSQGSKAILNKLRRAQRLVDQASRKKKPRAVKRKLKKATKLFNNVLPDITNDPQIPRAQAADLVEQIYGLLNLVGRVLNDLQTSGGSK